MTDNRHRKLIVYGLYANAALLLAVLVVLLNRGGVPDFLPGAYGQHQPPIAGGAGVFVMPGQLAERAWGCYLLDVDTQTLAVYQYTPSDRLLRLVAARSYKYDRRLMNYNTSPSPQEVQALDDKQTKEGRTNENVPVAPETPKD
ncbi:MAG TPA: hypothetical protein VIL86_02580 [Tepidisphaeraceae bacterium]